MSTVIAFKSDAFLDAATVAETTAEPLAAVATLPSAAPSAAVPAGTSNAGPSQGRAQRIMQRLQEIARVVIPPLLGLILMLGLWALVANKTGSIPGPMKTWDAAAKLFADP
ncbi:MAG: hypothetical protein WAX67_03150, partial [Rugosibacter sp.]